MLSQPPDSSAFASGRYQDLLAASGHSQTQIDERIATTFQQLFHGDPKTQALYYAAGRNADGPLAYLADVGNHDVRSEGMSYGMMIAVQTGHKPEFDALWNWANTYMRITDPANPSMGYFAWLMNTDGTPRATGAAPDGEEYFVMSLYFAANRWGGGKGIFDYKAQADALLHLMRHHPVRTAAGPFRVHPAAESLVSGTGSAPGSAIGSGTGHDAPERAQTVGPMVDEQAGMIVFVPDTGGNGFTDPSYHLPAFYDLWALWGPQEDRAFWARAAKVSRAFFSAVTDPHTGLSPDYANFDGTPRKTSFNTLSSDFSYDSWRVISNWSVDEAWWGRNPQAHILSERLQRFFLTQGLHTFADQYTLQGKPLSRDHSTGLVATSAVGSVAEHGGWPAKAFVDELWDTPIPSGEQRYFGGILYMMSLLHVSGRFRIWQPVQGHR